MPKLAKCFIDKLSTLSQMQIFYRDDLLKGFGVRVTESGVRSFILEKRISDKVKQITLGRYPELTVEQARKEAQKLLGKIATDVNSVAERKANQQRAITFQEALDDYLRVH